MKHEKRNILSCFLLTNRQSYSTYLYTDMYNNYYATVITNERLHVVYHQLSECESGLCSCREKVSAIRVPDNVQPARSVWQEAVRMTNEDLCTRIRNGVCRRPCFTLRQIRRADGRHSDGMLRRS